MDELSKAYGKIFLLLYSIAIQTIRIFQFIFNLNSRMVHQKNKNTPSIFNKLNP